MNGKYKKKKKQKIETWNESGIMFKAQLLRAAFKQKGACNLTKYKWWKLKPKPFEVCPMRHKFSSELNDVVE